MFLRTHLSERIPPNRTPIKDDTAMVMVAIGPACDIGRCKFSANNVGSQFLVAHPGKLGIAK